MLEIKVEDYLTNRVEQEFGGICEKHVSPGRIGPPDRLITWPWGVMRLAETKAPGKKVVGGSPQERDHKRRAALGIVVAVLDTHAKVDKWINAELAARPMPDPFEEFRSVAGYEVIDDGI